MLDIERSPQYYSHRSDNSICVDIKMPVDFASYLFSTSPPGFDLNSHYSLRSVRENFGLNEGPNKTHNSHRLPLKPIISSVEVENSKVCDRSSTTFLSRAKSLSDTHLCNGRVEEFNSEPQTRSCPVIDTSYLNETLNKLSLVDTSNKSKKGLGKKKVSFADDNGFALAAVRVFAESTDTPPRLRPELLSSLTQGASAGAVVTPPLVLEFTQPASDYVAFRNKIEKDFVSLENVIIKDYNLLGTIKVKNIAFEKSVKLRFTYDGWENHVDIDANYVPMNGSQTGNPMFDTFSFEFSVPPNFDISKKIEFAVLYEVDNRQIWDNNNGKNYQVVSADWKAKCEASKPRSPTESPVFDLSFHDTWSEFSSWSYIDDSVPYY